MYHLIIQPQKAIISSAPLIYNNLMYLAAYEHFSLPTQPSHVPSTRLDLLPTTQPSERPTRQNNSILSQAIDHDHKHIRANSSKNMPPTVELQ